MVLQKELITDLPQPKNSGVSIFIDEIKPLPNSPWAYMCLLSLPTNAVNGAVAALEADRVTHGFPHELHFSGLKHPASASVKIGLACLDRVLLDHPTWHFHILGLNTSTINLDCFGDRYCDQFVSAHRRFLRASLRYHLKSAHKCRPEPVVVNNIFHDMEGRLERCPFFRWHALDSMRLEDPEIEVRTEEIQFVNSNHNKEEKAGRKKASQLIQLCDLVLGAAHATLEPRQLKPGQDLLAKRFYPLIERLTDEKRCRNPQGRYRHYPRCHISFFPSRALTVQELEDPFARAGSTFYKGKLKRLGGQEALDLGSN